ncbi:MAG: hypothetical protein CMJ46_02110 [Planctomyces sp.]|nr:hypothetical protein [Planctomyces sp.]
MTSSEELNRLISAALDGQLTEAEQSELRAALRESSSARERYLEYAHLDSLLQWEQGDLPGLAEPPMQKMDESPIRLSSQRQVRRLRWMLAAALAICCLLSGLLFTRIGQPAAVAKNIDPLSESGPVAIISQVEDVVWCSTDLLESVPRKVGSPLSTGWVKIESGKVQIDFYSGATLLLEGPIELGINARNRAHLKEGKLTFFSGDQPEGFYLSSEHAQLYGEGASGGVVVNDRQLETHALAGTLKLFGSRMPLDVPEPVLLEAGNAFVLRKGIRNVEPVEFLSTSFARAEDLELREQPGTSRPFHFADQPMLGYGFQDGQHGLPAEAELLDHHERLVLRGNTWKMFEVDMEVTEDLVIEFEFRSDQEGQIHGFGFDTDDTYNDRSSIMQIHGYEMLPTIGQQYNTYAGEGWQRFRIPVGRYFSGKQKYLYFVADDDVTARATSEFRHVRFFRSQPRR